MSQQVNLFNPIFSRQKKPFSALAMLQGLGVVLLGVMLFYAYAQYQVVTMGRQAAETARRLETEQVTLTRVVAEKTPAIKSKELEEEVARLESQLKARQQVLEVLQSGELGNTAGFSEYLRAFSHQAMDGLWLTGFIIHGAGNRMAIDGRAVRPELVPAYIGRLNQEKVMQGKSFAAMEISLPAVKPDAVAAKEPLVASPRFIEFKLMSAEQEASK